MATPARVLVVDDSPTILKVVGSILARHGYETTIARDGLAGIEALKRGPKFDLVLLDFVMPRMNGYQFCRELRSSPAHRTLPVVLMSAKGDKIRGQFVQQTGAVDAITKPFDSRALVAVIEGALAKTAAGRARPVPEPGAMPDEDAIAESVRPSAAARHLRQHAVIELADRIAAVVTPAIAALSELERSDEASIRAAVGASLSGDALSAVLATLKDVQHTEAGKEVMSGDIAAIPLAEIMQVLQMQRQSGVLRITNYRAALAISMRQGNIDLVQSRGSATEYRLGRYFVERGLVARSALESLVADAHGELLGQALLRLGHITPDQLIDALSRQSSELVYDVLRWPYGRFAFSSEALRPEAETAHLGLNVSGLVLEGFRRVDEWRLMEGTIDFDQVVVADALAVEALGTEKLTRTEQLVLRAVDGVRTVSEVIAESAVSSFDAVKIVYQLLHSRVLRTAA